MLVSSQLELGSNVEINIIDVKSSKIIQTIKKKNLVVTSGINLARDLLDGTTTIAVNYLGVGTGTTAVAAGDTTLESEQFRGAITKRTSVSGAFTMAYYLSSTQGNGNDLTEAGLFDTSSGGSMFSRVTYSAITKTSSIAVMYSWTINMSAS